jgi:hypothetical protein
MPRIVTLPSRCIGATVAVMGSNAMKSAYILAAGSYPVAMNIADNTIQMDIRLPGLLMAEPFELEEDEDGYDTEDDIGSFRYLLLDEEKLRTEGKLMGKPLPFGNNEGGYGGICLGENPSHDDVAKALGVFLMAPFTPSHHQIRQFCSSSTNKQAVAKQILNLLKDIRPDHWDGKTPPKADYDNIDRAAMSRKAGQNTAYLRDILFNHFVLGRVHQFINTPLPQMDAVTFAVYSKLNYDTIERLGLTDIRVRARQVPLDGIINRVKAIETGFSKLTHQLLNQDLTKYLPKSNKQVFIRRHADALFFPTPQETKTWQPDASCFAGTRAVLTASRVSEGNYLVDLGPGKVMPWAEKKKKGKK